MEKRLLQFLTAENITQSQFADSIKVAKASVSHILAGRNKPGFDFIESTAKRYPELNIEWLITGNGKMYKGLKASETPPPVSNQNFEEPSSDPGERTLFDNDIETETSDHQNDSRFENIPFNQSVKDKKSKIEKILVFYDNGTYKELP